MTTGTEPTLTLADENYVHAAGKTLHSGSRQACRDCSPVPAPSRDGRFRCAVCDDGLRACTCPYGHHNEPIRSAP